MAEMLSTPLLAPEISNVDTNGAQCDDAASLQARLQLALEHHRFGRLSEAEGAYRQILDIEPGHADALHLLGVSFRQRGNIEAAVDFIEKAISASPSEPIYYNSLGCALESQGLVNEAVAGYRMALALKSDYAEAHFNLGTVLQAQGHLDEAAACYRQALATKPDFAAACSNLGNVLMDQGRLEDAAASYRKALALKPDFAEAHNNLGNVLQFQGCLAEAVASYRQALSSKPDFADAYNNLGNVLMDQGRLEEAAASYRKALAVKQDLPKAYSNLLFSLIHDENLTPSVCSAEHFAFAERFEGPLRADWQPHGNDRNPGRRLKVGFVSGDLRHHAMASFIEPVWTMLAPAAIELWVYSNHPIEDAVTQRLRRLVPHWHCVASMSDAMLADTVRAHGIDILIDLSGHTAHNRLLTFARKPAPVQATWIGYPGTTGLAAIDYLICDRFNAPYGLYERYYSEQFARLPTVGAFAPAADAPPVNELPALKRGYVTFASFNRPSKLGEAVIAAWSYILQTLPSAHLTLGNVDDAALAESLKARFGRYGIVSDRLRFLPRMAVGAYLKAHHEVDILLDTWPYSGGTTTQHALWMGVPVVTLRGPSRAHCQSAAALARIGLAAWIADDVPGFVRIALERAQDLDALAALRRGMRTRWLSSPWRQPVSVARGLEAALRIMWQRWCANLPAAHFEVAATTVDPGDALVR